MVHGDLWWWRRRLHATYLHLRHIVMADTGYCAAIRWPMMSGSRMPWQCACRYLGGVRWHWTLQLDKKKKFRHVRFFVWLSWNIIIYLTFDVNMNFIVAIINTLLICKSYTEYEDHNNAIGVTQTYHNIYFILSILKWKWFNSIHWCRWTFNRWQFIIFAFTIYIINNYNADDDNN